MMIRIIIGVVIGGIAGFLMGKTGSCTTGACPLTSNPWIGMIYGAVLGGMFSYVIGGGSGGGS